MSVTKPFALDPSNTVASAVTERYKSREDAFWAGVRHAMGPPAIVLFAGMVGFGAMGKTNGLDIWFTSFTSIFMFALPGQVVLFEMVITGSSMLAIILAVTLTATRFVTMTVTLFPQFDRKDRDRKLYASVHLVAMTAWAVSMKEFHTLEVKHRFSYFCGLGLVCWLISIPGTVIGFFLAGAVPTYITLGLVFINPLYFLLNFTEVKPWVNRIAIVLGCLLGPVFFLIHRDSSLLTTGLVAGTIAYLVDRKLLRHRPGLIS
ncbi:Predicted branched-chain amino acid permease (azaleucine resistance) [Polynucleobacter meluiroseus]|uniref:Predicted branched-chain amino acid permease (Azaleucine resistance) n=1 Tax=Polynucleobacter meluiroseus TaxID=1938814 RepID=A0A240E3X1_9BURK|nr:AzlC family ABC transporter permease [Polynucleobacter meluiroseus]SNX29216.1 Predicted branched-chain amino acid permease (azaleucine resistance) [Polynucleobacter meluiroseus]